MQMQSRKPDTETPWKEVFPPSVIYFDHDQPVCLDPLPAATGAAAAVIATDLPLVVSPGTCLDFEGVRYQLEREGLHCLVHGCYLKRHVIVYGTDEIALFRALSQIQVHSEMHDSLSYEEKLSQAKTGALAITCSAVSRFTMELAWSLGIRCRLVSVMTLDDWNGFDNGHRLLEYFHKASGKWRLLDIDSHVMMMKDGSFLSLVEFYEFMKVGGKYDLYILGEIGKFDPLSPMAPWCILKLGTEERLRNWYSRVCQAVALIDEETGGLSWAVDDPGKTKRLLAYNGSATCIPMEEWRRKFYVNN